MNNQPALKSVSSKLVSICREVLRRLLESFRVLLTGFRAIATYGKRLAVQYSELSVRPLLEHSFGHLAENEHILAVPEGKPHLQAITAQN